VSINLFLDCDQTLYNSQLLMDTVRDRIIQFMVDNLPLSYDEITKMRGEYLKRYGTTLTGLIRNQQVDAKRYMDYVHDIDLSKFITKNPELFNILQSIIYPIYIFSNAPRYHVKRVLKLLCIDEIPKKIYSIEDFFYNGKPSSFSYSVVLNETNIKPFEAILIDDDPQNLDGAKSVGMKTCLVGGGQFSNGYDFTINDINELPNILKGVSNA